MPRIDFLKGALKAHIHISLYERNTLQEQDAALLFLSVIPRGEIFADFCRPWQPLAAAMFFKCYQLSLIGWQRSHPVP